MSSLSLLALLIPALAVPNVTTIPLTDGCSSFPLYDITTHIAGPWTIGLSSSDNPAIENYGSTVESFRRAGDHGIVRGAIAIVDQNDIANRPLRCNGNARSTDAPTGVLEAWVPTGNSGSTWQQVNLTPFPYDRELMWGFPDATPVEAYQHIVDWEVQEGVFLGQAGVTTWGVKRYEAAAGTIDGLPY
jgi:hypothetical protein